MQSESWVQALKAGAALQQGDKAAAEAAAAAAATHAKAESALKAHGATASWKPQEYCSVVRGYLSSQPQAGAASRQARPRAPYVARHGDDQIEIEKRLEKLMKMNGVTAGSGLGDATWNRVLTRKWHEPPSDARPDNLKEMRSTLKKLAAKNNRSAELS